jgi:hypothetical protein
VPIAQLQNDRFKRGQAILLTFTADSTITSVTGWALKFALADRLGTTVLITKTVGSGITITSSTTVEVILDEADTDGIPAGLYFWDLQRTDPGEETNLANGTFYFDPDVG